MGKKNKKKKIKNKSVERKAIPPSPCIVCKKLTNISICGVCPKCWKKG